MVEVDVKCVKCNKGFIFDTKDHIGEIYKGDTKRPRIFHGYCPYCGKLNRIELPSLEDANET